MLFDITRGLNFFDGLETLKKEHTHAVLNAPYEEPRVTELPGGHMVASFDIATLLINRLKHDKSFRVAVKAKSDEWKAGHNYKKEPTVLRNFDDGVKARWHPELMRPAEEDEKDDLRVGLLFNCDDIEVVKQALGAGRGVHKQCGMQTAVLNLPAEERFEPDNILLPAIARASVYKFHGMSRVVSGVDKETGFQYPDECHAKDMRRLDKGIYTMLPDDELGGERMYRIRAWDMFASCDFLGGQSLLPYTEAVSSHVFCGACTFNRTDPGAYRPFSFLRQAPCECAGDNKRERGSARFVLRDWPTLKALLQRLRGSSDKAEIKAAYKAHGLNKLYYAFDPE